MMVPIVDTLLTCTRQNIALCEHRGEAGVVSDENFLALLRYRKVLQNHVESTAKNTIDSI